MSRNIAKKNLKLGGLNSSVELWLPNKKDWLILHSTQQLAHGGCTGILFYFGKRDRKCDNTAFGVWVDGVAGNDQYGGWGRGGERKGFGLRERGLSFLKSRFTSACVYFWERKHAHVLETNIFGIFAFDWQQPSFVTMEFHVNLFALNEVIPLCIDSISYVYGTVHHLYSWVKRNQLDAIYFIIYSILIQCSTCFGR